MEKTVIVSHVRAHEVMGPKYSEKLIMDYAGMETLSFAAVGLLSVLHAALHSSIIRGFPAPLDVLDELMGLKLVSYQGDGPNRVTVTLHKM